MTIQTNDPALEKALNEYRELMQQAQSIQLGTCNQDGQPEASYSPAVIDEKGVFHIYVSEMSNHTANMLKSRKASVMVIADESNSAQIFARKRATFQCEVCELERDSTEWNHIMELFGTKFGNVVDHLKGMLDFHLLALKPGKGRLVVGFGRAYDITGEMLDTLEHVKGDGGKGHRMAPKTGHTQEVGLSIEDVSRIVSHMNEDHSDSVLLYARHFARKNDATSAKLESIDLEAMEICLNSGETIRIPFEKPLRNSHDAHMTLVSMSKEARLHLEG